MPCQSSEIGVGGRSNVLEADDEGCALSSLSPHAEKETERRPEAELIELIEVNDLA